MSLLGTSLSVSMSHCSNVSSVQTMPEFLSAPEYWNDVTDPAFWQSGFDLVRERVDELEAMKL